VALQTRWTFPVARRLFYVIAHFRPKMGTFKAQPDWSST